MARSQLFRPVMSEEHTLKEHIDGLFNFLGELRAWVEHNQDYLETAISINKGEARAEGVKEFKDLERDLGAASKALTILRSKLHQLERDDKLAPKKTLKDTKGIEEEFTDFFKNVWVIRLVGVIDQDDCPDHLKKKSAFLEHAMNTLRHLTHGGHVQFEKVLEELEELYQAQMPKIAKKLAKVEKKDKKRNKKERKS